jgi:hypothetical protein
MRSRFDRDADAWSSYEFERFAADVIGAALGLPEASIDRGDDLGIDYVVMSPQVEPTLVEVKFDTPSTRRRIEVISDQLRSAAEKPTQANTLAWCSLYQE